MKKAGVVPDVRPAVVGLEDEDRGSRMKNNVSSESRAERPKEKLDSSLTRGQEKVLYTEERRIGRAPQKGSDEGSDVQSMVESMSDEWHPNDYTEIETGATWTSTDTCHGPEE